MTGRVSALALAVLIATSVHAADRLRVVSGVGPDGEATALWRAMAQKLHPHQASLAPKTIGDAERRWVVLIERRAASWQDETRTLAKNFAPLDGPELATIVVGNQGAEDAFTHDPQTIGFDVSRLLAEYGEATQPDNAARIDRFFRHEYVHLLQKAWIARHPYDTSTPLRAALFGIWAEGLGNYYSLSAKWKDSSSAATEALAALTPRLIARLGGLACAADGRALSADLSVGRFDRKWGALPVALWLEADARRSPDALRRFVEAGPEGVWTFLERHVPVDARPFLAEVRTNAALCHGI